MVNLCGIPIETLTPPDTWSVQFGNAYVDTNRFPKLVIFRTMLLECPFVLSRYFAYMQAILSFWKAVMDSFLCTRDMCHLAFLVLQLLVCTIVTTVNKEYGSLWSTSVRNHGFSSTKRVTISAKTSVYGQQHR